MINLTQLQQEVVNAPKGISLVSVGVGAGSTFAAVARATKICMEKDKHVVIFLSSKSQAHIYFNNLELIMKLIGYRVSKASQIFTNINTGSKIKILSPTTDDLIIASLKGEYIVEQPQNFKESTIRTIFNSVIKSNSGLTLLTNPIHCGNKDSWDYSLLDTKVLDIVWEELPEFKAQPKHYHDYVNVITGFGHNDNPYLPQSFSEVIKTLNKEDQDKLSGTWKSNNV